ISLQAGALGGLATLDGLGKISSGQLPAITITNVNVVADIAARDALTPVETGDVAIVLDEHPGLAVVSNTYIYDGTVWQEVKKPLNQYFAIANNLSELTSPSTARTNLGLGTGDSPVFTGLTLSGLTADSFIYSGTGGLISSTAAPLDGELLIGATGSTPVAATLTGTSNQVDVNNGAGSITLSTPQDIDSGATPQFAGLTLTGSGILANAQDVQFREATINGTNHVAIKAPAILAGDYTLTLPLAQGGASTYLQNDGSGNLSWAAGVGGFTDPMLNIGDIIIRDAGNITNRLAISGTTGDVLTVSAGGVPVWQTLPSAGAEVDPVVALINGLVKSNGTIISAATAGTDYSAGTSALTTGLLISTTGTGALSIATAGVDYVATEADPIAGGVTGIVLGDGAGNLSAAAAGTDYSAGTSALTTGLLMSTTGTGALSIATAGVDYVATEADPIAGGVTGILLGDGAGNLSAAVAGDFPTLNQSTTGTAANVTGTVAVANGGTGLATVGIGEIIYGSALNTYSALAIGGANTYLKSDGIGGLSWATPAGSGTITAVGDIATGAAFTATNGADGNNLYFEGATSNANEVNLTAADPGTDVTVTIPATTGTLLLDMNDLSDLNSVPTALSNLGLGTGDSPSFTGLTVSGGTGTLGGNAQTGSLEVYDGSNNKVTLTSPAIGTDYTLILPIDDGTAGQCLTTSDGTGTLAWAACGGGGGANTALSNLAAVAINTALLPGTTDSIALGSDSYNWLNLYLGNGGVVFEGATGGVDANETTLAVVDPTADQTITLPNATGTVLLNTNNLTDVSNTATARGNLGAAASGINTDITGLNGLNKQNAIQIGPYGLVAGNTGEARFLELAASGTDYAAIKSPDALAASYTLTLPVDDGTSSQFLQTDGSGVLSWATPTASSIAFNNITGGTNTSAAMIVGGTASLAPTTGSITANKFRQGVGTDTDDVDLAATEGEVAGILPVANGGTGTLSGTLGGVLFYATAGSIANTGAGANNQFLKSSSGGLPGFSSVALNTNDVTGILPILNRGGTGNGTAPGSPGMVVYTASTTAYGYTAQGSSGQLLRSGGAGVPTWTTATFPILAGASGNVLKSDGADWSSAAPTMALSGLSQASSSNTIANADYPQTWNWALTTAARTAFSLNESANSAGGSGSQYILGVGTFSTSSTAAPLKVTLGANKIIDTTSTGGLIFGNTAINTPITIKSGTGAIDIGTDVFAHTTTLGSTTGAASTVVQSGTGALKIETQGTGGLLIGNNAIAQTITVGNTTAGTSIALDTGTSGTIDIGASGFSRAINIGTGAAVVETITIGGTGANPIYIGNNQASGSINLGASMIGGTITIGGTAQTGGISIGTGTATQTLLFGTGTLETGTKNITIGNLDSGTTMNIKSGIGGLHLATANSGNITLLADSTGTMQIDTGLNGTINIGNGPAAKTINFGNNNTSTAMNITSGTGGINLTGKVRIIGTAPTPTSPAGTCSVGGVVSMATGSSDNAGKIQVTACTAGNYSALTISFSAAWTNAPFCTISATDNNSATMVSTGVWVTTATGSMTINVPAASTNATTWNYNCFGN
ncbi:MAG: hypothetical protein NTX82_05630, partial [Candidatus Parcubacteria bacterium]|nr:hypothetical protein [Candidatus Parcubacteria bacterium]